MRNNWLSEPYVVRSVRKALQSHGYNLHAKQPITAHGVDIVGWHRQHRHYIFVECKGYPTGNSEGAQRETYFLTALGQILCRMRQETAHYAVALPDHRFYRKRILRADMRRASRRLGLWFFLVGRDGIVQRLTALGTSFRPYSG